MQLNDFARSDNLYFLTENEELIVLGPAKSNLGPFGVDILYIS